VSATVYIFDPERRSREPDAQPERDPAGATIVMLPIVRVHRAKRAAYEHLRERLKSGPPLRVPPPYFASKSPRELAFAYYHGGPPCDVAFD
jgi:hypothetical protein